MGPGNFVRAFLVSTLALPLQCALVCSYTLRLKGSTMNTTAIDNTEDIIDVRDIITEFESVEDDLGSWKDCDHPLAYLLTELRGNGGDEQWRGDWYPITLIRDSYFKDYAMEFADDCGMTNDNESWPYTCIDWERAARELRMDYTSVEFDGVTYWYR